MIKKIIDPTGLFLSIPAAIILYLLTIGELPDNSFSIVLLGAVFIFGLPGSIPICFLGAIAAFAAPYEWWGNYLWYALFGISLVLLNLNGGIIARYIFKAFQKEKLSPFVIIPFAALAFIALLGILSL